MFQNRLDTKTDEAQLTLWSSTSRHSFVGRSCSESAARQVEPTHVAWSPVIWAHSCHSCHSLPWLQRWALSQRGHKWRSWRSRSLFSWKLTAEFYKYLCLESLDLWHLLPPGALEGSMHLPARVASCKDNTCEDMQIPLKRRCPQIFFLIKRILNGKRVLCQERRDRWTVEKVWDQRMIFKWFVLVN